MRAVRPELGGGAVISLGPACDPDMSGTCPVTGQAARRGGGRGSAVVLATVLGVALLVATTGSGAGVVLSGGVALASGLLLARRAVRAGSRLAATRRGPAVAGMPGSWAAARRA